MMKINLSREIRTGNPAILKVGRGNSALELENKTLTLVIT